MVLTRSRAKKNRPPGSLQFTVLFKQKRAICKLPRLPHSKSMSRLVDDSHYMSMTDLSQIDTTASIDRQ